MAVFVQFILVVCALGLLAVVVPVSASPIAVRVFRRDPGVWRDPPSDGLPYLVTFFFFQNQD